MFIQKLISISIFVITIIIIIIYYYYYDYYGYHARWRSNGRNGFIVL